MQLRKEEIQVSIIDTMFDDSIPQVLSESVEDSLCAVWKRSKLMI